MIIIIIIRIRGSSSGRNSIRRINVTILIIRKRGCRIRRGKRRIRIRIKKVIRCKAVTSLSFEIHLKVRIKPKLTVF